jgi:hypothetical protein
MITSLSALILWIAPVKLAGRMTGVPTSSCMELMFSITVFAEAARYFASRNTSEKIADEPPAVSAEEEKARERALALAV